MRGRWRYLILSLVIVCIAIGILLFSYTAPVLEWALSSRNTSFTIESAKWRDISSLELRNIHINTFAEIKKMDLTWNWISLLKRRIFDQVRVQGIFIDMYEFTAWRNRQISEKTTNVLLKKLFLEDIHISLNNIEKGLPPILIELAPTPPALVFDNVQLGKNGRDSIIHREQRTSIQNFSLYSPYDPLSRIFTFDKVEITFTWAELQEQMIRSLRFYRPVVYVGPDLFWFSDEVKKQSTKPSPNAKPWSIKKIEVNDGRLILASHGEPDFPLPGAFEGEMIDVVVGETSQINLKSNFRTHIEELNYPEYDLKFKNITADLRFNLPPEKADAENLVRTFTIESFEWKGLTFGESMKNPAWVSLTFEREGIFGTFGTPALGGYINGGVAVNLDSNMTWSAWANTVGTETLKITQRFFPEYLMLKSRSHAALQVSGRSKEVFKMNGEFVFEPGGALEINAVEKALQALPKDWDSIKREAARVSLEAFLRLDQAQGFCKIDYQPPESSFELELEGIQGKRHFNIKWKDLSPFSFRSP